MDVSLYDCPVSRDWLEDPVTAPCGHTFSRSSAVNWAIRVPECPNCRADWTGFDPDAAARNWSVAYMVHEYRMANDAEYAASNVSFTAPSGETVIPDWKGIIEWLRHGAAQQQAIGKLSLVCPGRPSMKTMLFIAVDHSGSMGDVLNQAKYALTEIAMMVAKDDRIILKIIPYCHEASLIRESNPLLLKSRIADISCRGGTDFSTAFTIIKNETRAHANDSMVANFVTIFMTDGQDSFGGDRDGTTRAARFKREWADASGGKPRSFHSLGFGRHHDESYMDRLRMSGSSDGTYAYADPDQNEDDLFVKFVAIFSAIQRECDSMCPVMYLKDMGHIKLVESKYRNMDIGNVPSSTGTFWVTSKTPHMLASVCIQDSESVKTIVVQQNDVESDDRNRDLWKEWIQSSMDTISEEMVSIVESGDSTVSAEKNLHLSMLKMRMRAIMSRVQQVGLDESDPATLRAAQISQTLDKILNNESIDKKKLGESRFAGMLGLTTTLPNQPRHVKPTDVLKASTQANVGRNTGRSKMYVYRNTKRFHVAKDDHEFLRILAHGSNSRVLEWLDAHPDFDVIQPFAPNGESAMHILMCTHRGLFTEFWDRAVRSDSIPDMLPTNTFGENIVDYAIIYNLCKSAKFLLNKGYLPTIDGMELIRSVIWRAGHRKYFQKMANLLITSGLCKFDRADLVKFCQTKEAVEWLDDAERLSANNETTKVSETDAERTERLAQQAETKFELALDKLDFELLESVKNHIPAHVPFEKVVKLAKNRNSTEAFRILQFLIVNNHIDVQEIVEGPPDLEEPELGPTRTWPLFIAASAGNIPLLDLILERIPSDMLSNYLKQTDSYGVTVLWIASCCGHLDIVLRLLSFGADPNAVNSKGDPPLLPACQTSKDVVVDALLMAGARWDVYNPKRENAILVCCRTGHEACLRSILSYLNPKDLEKALATPAHIDGFTPLLAAAELDHDECIRTCKEFGADIHWQTDLSNPIIAGATALHLACFYGRYKAVRALIELNAEYNSPTNGEDRMTPLHIAVKKGHAPIVGFLLQQKDIDVGAKDGKGRTADFYSKANGNELIRELFFSNPLEKSVRSILATPDTRAIMQIVENHAAQPGILPFSDVLETLQMGDHRTPILAAAVQYGRRALASDILESSKHHGVSLDVLLDMCDDWGLSTRFWIAHMQCESWFDADELRKYDETHETWLEKKNAVECVLKQSFQNRLILALKAPSVSDLAVCLNVDNTNEELKKNPRVMVHMSGGFEQPVHPEAKSRMTAADQKEAALVTFLNQLEKMDVSTDEGKDLKRVIREGRIHLVSTAATGHLANISPLHVLSLYLYTGSEFVHRTTNEIIQTWSAASAMKWAPFIQCLTQAVHALPAAGSMEVYRAVRTPSRVVVPEDYPVGSELCWENFVIASMDWKMSAELVETRPIETGVVFLIQSRNARRLGVLSRFPIDEEVIFPPMSRFRVLRHYAGRDVVFGQKNIRESSCMLDEAMANRVRNRKMTMVVEIEEIV